MRPCMGGMRAILIVLAVVVIGLWLFSGGAPDAEPDPAQKAMEAVFAAEPDAELLTIESTNFGARDARYLVLRWRPRANRGEFPAALSDRLCSALSTRAPPGFETVVVAAVLDERVQLGPVAFGRRGLLGFCWLGERIDASMVRAIVADLDSWR